MSHSVFKYYLLLHDAYETTDSRFVNCVSLRNVFGFTLCCKGILIKIIFILLLGGKFQYGIKFEMGNACCKSARKSRMYPKVKGHPPLLGMTLRTSETKRHGTTEPRPLTTIPSIRTTTGKSAAAATTTQTNHNQHQVVNRPRDAYEIDKAQRRPHQRPGEGLPNNFAIAEAKDRRVHDSRGKPVEHLCSPAGSDDGEGGGVGGGAAEAGAMQAVGYGVSGGPTVNATETGRGILSSLSTREDSMAVDAGEHPGMVVCKGSKTSGTTTKNKTTQTGP